MSSPSSDRAFGDQVKFCIKHTFIDVRCRDEDSEPALRRQKSDPLFAYVPANEYPAFTLKCAEPLTPTTCDNCSTPTTVVDDCDTLASGNNDDCDENVAYGNTFSFAGIAALEETDTTTMSAHGNDAFVGNFSSSFGVYGLSQSHAQQAGSWHSSAVWPEMHEASLVLSTHQQLLSSECQWGGIVGRGDCSSMHPGDASSRIPVVNGNPAGHYFAMQASDNYYTMSPEEASAQPQDQHNGYQITQFDDALAPAATVLPPPPPPPLPLDDAQMTVMVRNLQEDLSQPALVEQLMNGGYKGLFDFVYMPMNFRDHGHFGYAFVNFVSNKTAVQFMNQIQAHDHGDTSAWQEWDIAWSTCQGLSANIERYRNSPLMHELVPRECKPALYDEHGCQVTFPQPTKTIPKPRVHWPGPRDAKVPFLKDRSTQVEAHTRGGSGDATLTSPVPERRPGRSKNNQRQRAAADARHGLWSQER